MKRHTTAEPIFWSLFGAGGTLAALLWPAFTLLLFFVAPLGFALEPSAPLKPGIRVLLANPYVMIAMWISISLFFWHAMHRLLFLLHDFQIHTNLVIEIIFYGIALAGTIVSGYLIYGVYILSFHAISVL